MKFWKYLFLLLSALRTLSSLAEPANLELLGDTSQLPGPTTADTVVRLSRARVVMANYDLIRRDFPHTNTYSNAQIDAWLLQQAYISQDQTRQTEFNSEIPVEAGSEKLALRPKEYNRAHVIETDGGGAKQKTYLDVKGVGIASAKRKHGSVNGDPRNGLLSLGDATREFLMHRVVTGILAEQTPEVRTVNYYAVLDAGFEKKNFSYRELSAEEAKTYQPKPGEHVLPSKDHKALVVVNGNADPAALLLRQPHTRFEDPRAESEANRGHYFLLPEAISKRVEMALRRYGLTSEGSGERAMSSLTGEMEGGINIQGGRNAKGWHILDFGNFIFRPSFDESRPVTHFYGQKPLLTPGTSDWVQPEASLMLRANQWGSSDGRPADSKYDNPWVWSHQAAEYIAAENRRAHEAAARGETMLADAHFANARRAAEVHFKNMLLPFQQALEERGCERGLSLVGLAA